MITPRQQRASLFNLDGQDSESPFALLSKPLLDEIVKRLEILTYRLECDTRTADGITKNSAANEIHVLRNMLVGEQS